MKNKVLTNSLRTLTSNILILETKQLKTSFWEVRLLYFSFFKKSFLKVTQTLLSFLSFFFGQSDWFLWNLFSRNFFNFPSFFFWWCCCFFENAWFASEWLLMGRKTHGRNDFKSMRSILLGTESDTGTMPSAQTHGAPLLFCWNTGFYSSKVKISFAG